MKKIFLFIAVLLLADAPMVMLAQTASCISLGTNLSRGSRSFSVELLQEFLIAGNYLAPGNNTGYFGPLTQTAVQSFQMAQDIVSSGSPATTGWGNVGPRTRAAIRAQTCQQPNPVTFIP